MSSAKIMWVQKQKAFVAMWAQLFIFFAIIAYVACWGASKSCSLNDVLFRTNPVFYRNLLTRWAVHRGSASATAATSCATPPPPWSPPSPPSPPSSHLFSSFSPCPSPSPPSLPSSSLWPISRQIRLLPQGVNSARELYHNYLEQQMLQSLVFRRNKRFL